MARQLSKKHIRDVVTANQPCAIGVIVEKLGAGDDEILFNHNILKGYLEQMVERRFLSLEKGDYSISVKAPGGAAPTRLFRVQAAKDGSLSMAESEYSKENEGKDGWKRTPLAAVGHFKTEAYAVWLAVLGPIRELQSQYVKPVENPDDKEKAA